MVLLDALAKLRVERPDAHLVCVGRAKPNGPADRRLDELGLRDAVTFRSGLTQEELVALMQSAEVAAVPSFYEGFCLPAVEEMACGLPLVATRVGALPEIVGEDNTAGSAGARRATPRRWPWPSAGCSTTRSCGAGSAPPDAVGSQERFTWRAAAAGTADWYRERIAAVRGGGQEPDPTTPQVAAPC